MYSRIRTIFAIGLLLSLHFTVCTGGIFSVTIAFASQFTDTAQKIDGPMSVEILLCIQMSPASEEDIANGNVSEKGCDNDDTCFETAQRYMQERDALEDSMGAVDIVNAKCTLQSEIDDVKSPPLLSQNARAGPLYEHSYLLAQTLIKRE